MITGLIAAGVAPASGAAAAGDPVITPAQAMQVVRAWLPADNAAMAAFNVAAINSLEGPPQSDTDAPVARARLPGTPWPGLSSVSVYVPDQSAYPAQFMTLVVFSTGENDYFVFTKQSKSAPWKVVYNTPLNPQVNDLVQRTTEARPILVDQHGYANLVTGSSDLEINPSALPHTAVSYIQQSLRANSPVPSKIFDPTLAQFVLTGTSADEAHGSTETHSFTVGAYPVYSYRTQDGGALTFVAWQSHIHLASMASITLPNQTVLGLTAVDGVPGLTLGQPYRSMDLNVLSTLAFAVAPRTSGLPVGVVGYAITPISGTGVPG